MKTDRRQFLKTAAAGFAALASERLIASVDNVLGDTSLSVVSDGHLVLPANFILPADVPQDEAKSFLAAHAMDNSAAYEPACNIAVWRRNDRVMLFDVGAGSNFMASTGRLLESLEQADIDPLAVTDVFLTHAHPDHLWGLIDDFDELTFPEASYHMCAAEWDFWRAADTIDKLPESRKSFAAGAQRRLEYIEDRVQLFQYGDEPISGVEAVNSAGHTPGHTSFALHSGTQSAMILGDALTHPLLSFQKFDWPSNSDYDPALGRKTRARILDRLAHESPLVLGFHLPYPGTGTVDRDGSAYRFVSD